MSTVKDLGAVSAYALAVKYGYVGTEKEWVNEQEAKRKQAVEAASSAAINANTVLQNVSVARESATTASNARNEAVGAAEQAKTYAENAEAVTGIEIAKKDRAGIVKGGENHIAEDGTLQLTVTTTERTIQNSYAGGVKINEIDGASEQESTTGKNLLKCSGLVKQTVGGITFTPVYKNGMLQYIEANGTCTATNLISFNLPSITLQADEEYVLSGCPSGGSVSKYYIQYNYFTADFGTGSKITGIESPTNVRIVVINGTTVNNLKFYPMIRLASVEDATYEPYTGNAPSPSTDYPQEIKSVIVGEIKTTDDNGNESIINLSNPITLHGIGDVKDRIVWKDGVFGVDMKFFEGAISTELDSTKVAAGSKYCRMNLLNIGFPNAVGAYYATNKYALSNRFNVIAQSGIASTTLENVFAVNDENIYFRVVTGTTLEEFMEIVAKGIEVVYPLAEPTFEPLPTEDQIALHSLKSFDTVTYISTDSEIEPVIEVECGTSKVGGYNLDAWNTAKRNEIALADLTSAVLALNQE